MCKQEKTKILFGLMLAILIVITIILVSYFILIYKFGKPSQNSIVKQYFQNKLLFDDAINELQKIADSNQHIYIYNHYNDISISIYNYNEDDLNIIRVDKENFYAYQHSINLAERLHLTRIVKKYGNTIFSFPFGQAIAEINDEDKLHREYRILEEIHIADNWYYIQIKT